MSSDNRNRLIKIDKIYETNLMEQKTTISIKKLQFSDFFYCIQKILRILTISDNFELSSFFFYRNFFCMIESKDFLYDKPETSNVFKHNESC